MKVILHIGHSKTGSSAIQSYLAENVERLKSFGICYPEHPSFASARAGKPSSGNLDARPGWSSRIETALANRSAPLALFSSEGLFDTIRQDMAELRRFAGRFDLTLVLFVRDPFDHVHSAYGQAVKRHGYVKSIDEFARRYELPNRVLSFLDAGADDGMEVVVRNYSRHSRNIVETFVEAAFGEASEQLLAVSQPGRGVVNRSMSRVEYEIQRRFNTHFGARSSRFVSDALVEAIPDQKSEREPLSDAVARDLEERLRPAVDALNTRLDPAERLSLQRRASTADSGSDAFTISGRQIDVLAKAISDEIRRSSMTDVDGVFLRDIALKLETEERVNRDEAVHLLQLAQKVRPHGGLIRKKLAEYRKR